MKKYILINLLLVIALSKTYSQQKDYAILYKHIIESSAKDFKDSIGEKFTNERGDVFKASNYIDADEAYYNKPPIDAGLTYFAIYKYDNINKDAVQKQMTDFMNDYKSQGLASVEPIVQNGVNYLLMKAKDNGKFIAALSDDPVKKSFQVWVFSGWNVVKAPNEFCISLQKAITVAQSNAFSLSEFQGEPNSTGPVFKNSGDGTSFYFSKLDIPGAKQTVIYKGSDKITFEAIMSVYQFKYMVQSRYEEIIKKVEGCINDMQMHVTKENNGPQNTFYNGDHVQIGVRWFTRNDTEFIIYIQVEHL